MLSHERKPSKVLSFKPLSLFMFLTGVLTLLISIVFNSSNLAFIGLGLLFLGIALSYIRTEGYVKKQLFDAIITSHISSLNETTKEFNYNSHPVYLPPKYFENPDAQKVYLSKQKEMLLPTPDQMPFWLQSGYGILLTPTGIGLEKLFEKTLERNFVGVDLQYLQRYLSKAFTDLEVAKGLSIRKKDNSIIVAIENCKIGVPKATLLRFAGFCMVNSPISSAIACALSKATGLPLTIVAENSSLDGRNMTIEYNLISDFQISAI